MLCCKFQRTSSLTSMSCALVTALLIVSSRIMAWCAESQSKSDGSSVGSGPGVAVRAKWKDTSIFLASFEASFSMSSIVAVITSMASTSSKRDLHYGEVRVKVTEFQERPVICIL